MEPPGEPKEILSRRGYAGLLALAAAIGAPVAVAAWGYLQLLHEVEHLVWEEWPADLGYDAPPWWWIVAALLVAGAVTGFAVAHLAGHGGHPPLDGFSSEPVEPRALPGILLAPFASLALGAVLGPEAPLLALGGGLGVLALRRAEREPAARVAAVAAVAGSFAALSTVFGSPLVAAFLLMELVGLGGPMLSTVLLPGLLAAGVGSLVFTGLGRWTGRPNVELEPITLAPFARPDLADVLWAVAIGVAAALLTHAIKTVGRTAQALVARRPLVATPLAGLAVAVCAIVFGATSDHGAEDVLFSGQTRLGPLIERADEWSAAALALVILLKGVAYGVSLGSFRGGPVFPALYIGAAGGLLLADLPGLGQTPAVAAGMGAMTAAVFGAPLSSVLLVAIFLIGAGPQVIALVIVAVVAAHVATAWLPHARSVPGVTTKTGRRRPVQAAGAAAAPTPVDDLGG